METNVTVEEAREILTAPGYDAYGKTRIYAIWNNQIVSVKSTYYLDRYADDAERIYVKTNNGTVPIGRA